jgi:hypothetical protein
MTHPLLNYIPGQNPELHPWTGGYISWGPAQESSVPGSPEHLQEEPPVELGSVSELLLSSEYSDIRSSISTVRNISYQELISRSDQSLGYQGLGKRENLQLLISQPFRGESQATRIGCPCNCCIIDICFILVVTVILIIVFYFEIHKFIIELEVDYWNLQWSWKKRV